MTDAQPHIGTLAEKSLHADLKRWIARPGDQLEVSVEGYVVDVVRGERLLEVQTRHLYALKRKLRRLLANHAVELFHPIPAAKWIVRLAADGTPVSRRKSPRRGTVVDIFRELVRLTALLDHPRLTITVLLTQEEEVWRDDGQGSWRRRGWSVADRRLLDVVETHSFSGPRAWLALLPAGLPDPFTNRDLARDLRCRDALSRQVTYTLRRLALLEVVGKEGNAHLMRLAAPPPAPS